MSLTSGEPLLFNYGWDHVWYDAKCIKNISVREVVKGPFVKPQLVCSIPFVTHCQQDGTPVELTEGIPDCWAEYLTEKLRFYQKHLRNYELMHKENADVVPHLRKYRLYIGQGIPDPWAAYLYNPEIFSHPKDTEHRKHSKNKKEERCFCCEREYLFECPDKCVSNLNKCSCKDCHGKTSTGSESAEKCRCSEIFHSWVLENSRRRRRRRGSSGDCLSSQNGSHSETDDDGGHLKDRNKCVAFCECSGSENSGIGSGDHEKTLRFSQENDKFFKHHSKVYFCPYIQNFCRRKSQKSDKIAGEPKVSKEIQTEIPTIKCSKTVQTEKSGKPKCTCRSKCFPCSVVCSRSCVKSGCPAAYSIPNFCCAPSFTQRPAFVCPYSFANHFTFDKHYNNETVESKKRRKKKKQVKEKDSEEESNAELGFDQPEAMGGRENPSPKSTKPKEHLHETVESINNVKCNNNAYNSQTPSTALDHMKFLSNYKLKGYLREEEISPGLSGNKFLNQNSSTGLKYRNFSIGNSSLNSLKHEDSLLDKFKRFSCYRYSDLNFPVSKMNIRHSNFSNVRRFSYCDQATMTALNETENLKSDVSTKGNVPKETIDGDEPKACGFVRNREVAQALGKRRKLLRNRKRRRKLVASILDSSTKPPKRTSVHKKEVQVDETLQEGVHSKKYSSQNFPSSSNHLNSGENDYLRFGGTILNPRYKQEVLKKQLGMFTCSQYRDNSFM